MGVLDTGIKVQEGVLPTWAGVIGNDVPLLASGPWISATSHRLTPRRVTFLAYAAGRTAGLQAAVVDDPGAYETCNLYRMLLAEPMVFKFPLAAIAARASLRELAEPAARWFPNLAVLYPGYDCFVAGSAAAADSLSHALVAGVCSWAADQGMRAVSFQYVAADSQLAWILAERGLRRLPLTFRARLQVDGDFAEYLHRLPPKRRAEVLRERRRLSDAGMRTKRCDHTEFFADIVALRCGLMARYGHSANPERESRNLSRLIGCFGPDGVRLYCCLAAGRAVGFSLFVVWNGVWYAAYTGTLARPDTRFVYFDHLIYSPYADAATEGARVLDLGVGAWQAKQARGCALLPADVWAIGLDEKVDRSIELAATAMVPEAGAAPRTATIPGPAQGDRND